MAQVRIKKQTKPKIGTFSIHVEMHIDTEACIEDLQASLHDFIPEERQRHWELNEDQLKPLNSTKELLEYLEDTGATTEGSPAWSYFNDFFMDAPWNIDSINVELL